MVHLKKLVTIPILVAVLIGFVPLQVASATIPASAPEYVSQFGSPGSGNGQLAYPMAIAVSSTGRIYVGEYENSRVQIFDSAGTYISQFGTAGSGNGEFSNLINLAIDSNDNIYVSDRGNNRIQKFSSNGTYISQFGTYGSGDGEFEASLEDVAINSAGDIYVVDRGNSRIQKFSSNGTYISQFGTAGSGNGEFSQPRNIAFDSHDNVFVSDSGNTRIQKFSSNGTYISQFGTSGTGNGQFMEPYGLAIDSNDNIYVNDYLTNRTQKFNSSGTYLSQFGLHGVNSDEYVEIYNVYADPWDNIFMASAYEDGTGSNYVQKFSYPAESIITNSVTGKAVELAVTPIGTSIRCNTSVAASSLPTQDSGKSYPMGLVDFCLGVPTGGLASISLTFETDLAPDKVTARKYNKTTHTYSNIPGANVVEVMLSGKHALLLNYDIVDGGPLDDDGVANGIILDPVGLSVQAGTLADTGDNQVRILIAGLISVSSAISLMTYIYPGLKASR